MTINPADQVIRHSRQALRLNKDLAERDTLASDFDKALYAAAGAAAGLHQNRDRLADLKLPGVPSKEALMAWLGAEITRILPIDLF